MAGALSALEAIGTGFGQGMDAIQQQQQMAARIALDRLAFQQQQQKRQTLAAMLPGVVAAFTGPGPQQPPGPPAGFTGPGFAGPGDGTPPTAAAPPAASPAPPRAPNPLLPDFGQSAGLSGNPVTPSMVPVPPSLVPQLMRESGGNYQAKNPTSSAGGGFQDISSTWREAMQGLGYGNDFPDAKTAPPSIQNAANVWLQARRGNKPWAASAPPGGYPAPGAGMTGAGQAAVRGLPPELVAQGQQAAQQVTQQFDPMEYGRVQMQRAVEAIDQQDIPPEVKVMAIWQMAQLLQPQDRMALSMYAMQSRDLINLARLHLQEQGQAQKGDIAQQNVQTRREIAGIGEGGAPTANVDNVAEMIANYQMAPLSGWTMRGAWGQQVMNRVKEINPDYQATQFGARQSAARAFASGPQSNIVRSMSVAIDHLGVAEQLGIALQNNDPRLLNQAKNLVKTQFGYEGPVDFNTAKMIVSDEVTKAVAGGVLSMTERMGLADQLSSANSPEQLSGVISTLKRLLAGQLGGLRRQFEVGTGQSEEQFGQRLSPQAQQELGAQSKEQEKPGGTPVPKEFANDPDGTTYNGGKLIKRGNQLVPQ